MNSKIKYFDLTDKSTPILEYDSIKEQFIALESCMVEFGSNGIKVTKRKETPMNGKEFVQFHKDTVTKMNDICRQKNQDYSGGGDADAFNNFKMVEQMGICTAEQGFLVRMTDKMMRITNITNSGKQAVKDESVKDTLMDLANYSILMMGYLTAKQEDKPKHKIPLPPDALETELKFHSCFGVPMNKVIEIVREWKEQQAKCEIEYE